MSEEEMVSRICEVELYLTKKFITLRGTGYKPIEGDEEQLLRDELKELRNTLNNKDMLQRYIQKIKNQNKDD